MADNYTVFFYSPFVACCHHLAAVCLNLPLVRSCRCYVHPATSLFPLFSRFSFIISSISSVESSATTTTTTSLGTTWRDLSCCCSGLMLLSQKKSTCLKSKCQRCLLRLNIHISSVLIIIFTPFTRASSNSEYLNNYWMEYGHLWSQKDNPNLSF